MLRRADRVDADGRIATMAMGKVAAGILVLVLGSWFMLVFRQSEKPPPHVHHGSGYMPARPPSAAPPASELSLPPISMPTSAPQVPADARSQRAHGSGYMPTPLSGGASMHPPMALPSMRRSTNIPSDSVTPKLSSLPTPAPQTRWATRRPAWVEERGQEDSKRPDRQAPHA